MTNSDCKQAWVVVFSNCIVKCIVNYSQWYLVILFYFALLRYSSIPTVVNEMISKRTSIVLENSCLAAKFSCPVYIWPLHRVKYFDTWYSLIISYTFVYRTKRNKGGFLSDISYHYVWFQYVPTHQCIYF